MSEMPVRGERTELWMLVDLEPGYEAFEVGDRTRPTTEWITADDIPGGVPDALLTRVAGVVEPDPDSGKYGWLHLGRNFSTSLRTWTADPGPVTVEGLLLYDRYLWIEGDVREGEAVVLERATLARPVTWQPTGHPNWYTSDFHGDNAVNYEQMETEGTDTTWICVRIGIDSLD